MSLKTSLLAGASFGFAALLATNLMGVSSAQTSTSKADVEKIVKEYILENPEIIAEALDLYAEEEELRREEARKDALANNLPALLNPKDGFATGATDKEAKVAVIEMFDYHCGFCKQASDYMYDLSKNNKDIKVVFRELPLLREESNIAAKAALAARDQGKYLDFHFALMNASGTLTRDRIERIASDVGVKVQDMNSKMETNQIDAILDRTLDVAIDIELSGTPAFIVAAVDGSYINVVPGWAPDEVDRSIKEARAAFKG